MYPPHIRSGEPPAPGVSAPLKPNRRKSTAMITVIELGYGGVRNFLPNVVHVHQHLLALFRMTVFGIVFAFLIESSEQMSRFMSHRAVGSAVGDQRDPLRRLRASERP